MGLAVGTGLAGQGGSWIGEQWSFQWALAWQQAMR